MKTVRIGILGCGAIGSELARRIDRGAIPRCRLAGISDIRPERSQRLARSLRHPVRILSPASLIRRSDFLIEAAQAGVVPSFVRSVLKQGKSVLVMSAGGLLADRALARRLPRRKGKVYLASGALAGIDGVLAAKAGGIRRARLVTRKPPEAFCGAPFFRRSRLKPDHITKETLLFKGAARQAVRLFPQNVNVAAVLSLAGIGARKTSVEIYASPGLRRNIHEVHLEGRFGRIVARTENVPAPGNPRTSFLAALSPAALLEKLFGPFACGT